MTSLIKYYDPRVWLRKGEDTFKERLVQAFEDLNNVNQLDKDAGSSELKKASRLPQPKKGNPRRAVVQMP